MLGVRSCVTSLLTAAFLSSLAPRVVATDFATPASYPVGTNPVALVTGDFNGDGKLDIAVANSGSANVSVLLGNGDGTFLPAKNFAAGVSVPAFLLVADFNNDGKTDLLTFQAGNSVSGAKGTYAVLLGNGDGTFQNPTTTVLTATATALAAGDFNLDKKVDLVVSNFDSDSGNTNLQVFSGVGDGSFTLAQTTSLPSSANGISTLVVADFNSDSKPDLAVVFVSAPLQIFLGKGDATFQSSSQSIGTRNGFVMVGDFNGDQKADIAIRVEIPRSPTCRTFCISEDFTDVYLGKGDGTFAAATRAAFFVGSSSGNLAAGDFNADSKLDLFFSRAGKGLLYLGKSDGSFVNIPFSPSGIGVNFFAADFNKDQLTDLMYLDTANNAVVVIVNAGPSSGADFAVTVSPNQANVTIGAGDFTYTASVYNQGPQDGSNVVLSESIPSGLKLASVKPGQGSCSGTVSVTCNLGTLPDPSVTTVQFTVTPVLPGTYTDALSVSASPSDLNSKNNSASISLTATLPADLAIVASPSETTAKVGDRVTVTVKITNAGPASAANVVLNDDVTDSAQISSINASQGNCTDSGGVLSCALGALPQNSTITVTYVLTPGTPELFDNNMSVSSDTPDLNGDNNSVDLSIPINPADLALTITESPSSVVTGAPFTYTLSLANKGPSTASNVMLNDALPSNATVTSVTASQGSCSAPANSAFTCSLGSLSSGTSATVTLILVASSAGSITDSASVSANEPDPDSSNNSAELTVQVDAAPDFSINTSVTNLSMHRGAQASVTLSFPLQGGFGGTIALTCAVSGPAPTPSCAVNPASVSAGQSAILTVTAPSTAILPLPRGTPLRLLPIGLMAAWLALLALRLARYPVLRWKARASVLWSSNRGPRFATVCLILFAAGILVAVSGCNSSSTTPPPVSYSVVVTATSGSLHHTSTIPVTVQ